MKRSEFLKLAAGGPWFASALRAEKPKPRIVPMLEGTPGEDTDLKTWFQDIGRWGVRQWAAWLLTTYRLSSAPGEKPSLSVPFLADTMPEFKPHVDAADLQAQENKLRRTAQLCRDNNIEFWINLPFPIFPTRNMAIVRKVLPQLFQAEKLNLYHPQFAEVLGREVQALKQAIPDLRGITLRLTEGGGGVELTRDDLRRNNEWERPLVKTFDAATRELRIGGNVMAHHYLHTAATHREVFKMLADFPALAIMDDITWPEEDMLHPFVGYLPESDRRLLFCGNPVALKFLLDTEYIGQGVLPSVYPRWWKYNITESVRSGVATAVGRVFFWDAGRTDLNFNRLNVYIFTRLCYDPGADPRQLLGEAAREMFGEKIPAKLIDILWETEPMIKKIVGVNGVDSLDHSRFPQPQYLDARNTLQSTGMKTVGDLFSPPGTVLYPKLTDELVNYDQWRWQNKTVALPASAYLDEKRQATAWVMGILPEVERLSRPLSSTHREMFTRGYGMLAALAQGMELYVETAAAHYEWARARTLQGAPAREKFHDLAARWKSLADRVPDNPFSYRQRMLAFAEFLLKSLPQNSGG